MIRFSGDLESERGSSLHQNSRSRRAAGLQSTVSNISADCESFLRQCFKYDIKERPFIEDLLAHDFISKNSITDGRSRFNPGTQILQESEIKELNFSRPEKSSKKPLTQFEGGADEEKSFIKKMASNASKVTLVNTRKIMNKDNSLMGTIPPASFLKKDSLVSVTENMFTELGDKSKLVILPQNVPKLHLPKPVLEQETGERKDSGKILGRADTFGGHRNSKNNEELSDVMYSQVKDKTIEVEDSPVLDRFEFKKRDNFIFKPQPAPDNSLSVSVIAEPKDLGELEAEYSRLVRETEEALKGKIQKQASEHSIDMNELEAEQQRMLREMEAQMNAESKETTEHKNLDELEAEQQRYLAEMEALLAYQSEPEKVLLDAPKELSPSIKAVNSGIANQDQDAVQMIGLDELEAEQLRLMAEMEAALGLPAKEQYLPNLEIIEVDKKSQLQELARENQEMAPSPIFKIDTPQKSSELGVMQSSPYFRRPSIEEAKFSQTDLPGFAQLAKLESLPHGSRNSLGVAQNPTKRGSVSGFATYTFRNGNEPPELHDEGLSEDSSFSENFDSGNKKKGERVRGSVKHIKVENEKDSNRFSIPPDFKSKADNSAKSNAELVFYLKSPDNDNLRAAFSSNEVSEDHSIAHPPKRSKAQVVDSNTKSQGVATKKPLMKKMSMMKKEVGPTTPSQNNKLQLPTEDPPLSNDRGSPLPEFTTGLTPMIRDKFKITLKRPEQVFDGELYSSSDSEDSGQEKSKKKKNKGSHEQENFSSKLTKLNR